MSDRQVEDLKAQVADLQARLERLEAERSPKSGASEESMRMILIGPPGAGMKLEEADSQYNSNQM